MLIFFTSRHYYFFEKLKIVEKQLCKLNGSYGKVSHTLKEIKLIWNLILTGNGSSIDCGNEDIEKINDDEQGKFKTNHLLPNFISYKIASYFLNSSIHKGNKKQYKYFN